MKKFITKHSDIEVGNIVVFCKEIEDISILSFLSCGQNIIGDIQKSFQDSSSSLKEYFLGGKKYKKLYVFITKEKNYKNEVLFLGKYFPKLPGDLCLFSKDEETKKMLFEVCELSRYEFQVYKTEKKEKNTQVFCTPKERDSLSDIGKKIDNIFLARDLGNIPSSDLTPDIFSQRVKKTKFQTSKVKVLSYKDIQKKGLGLIEGVGKGSHNSPRVVLIEHIIDKKKPVIGIVGKGITFDTGGNQIKPGDAMYEMKGDMGGAAVGFVLSLELERKNIQKNFVICLVLAENVVSSEAYKPSDILKAYNGKTVEIIHTDAEGRLVLADGISYIGKNYNTERIITIATLTGACVAALGYRYAGVMGTDKELIQKLVQYGKENTEQYIELPFDDYFLEKTHSEIADYKNLDRSVHAGASMGAAFLANFLENKEAYTHIDIAGVYINGGEAYGKCPKTMTGFGVESLGEVLSTL